MEQGKSIFGRKVITIILAIVIVAAGSFYYYSNYYHKNSASQQSSNLPEGWSSYQATKYGFQFMYIKSWGSPQITETKYGQGKTYNIAFNKLPPDKNQAITITMDTINANKKVCVTVKNCQTIKAVTADFIQQQLQKQVIRTVTSDKNGYAIMYTASKNSSTYNLSVFRMIDLSSLNISAAVGSFSKVSKVSCSTTQLASTQNGCINQEDYNNVVKLLSSIKKL